MKLEELSGEIIRLRLSAGFFTWYSRKESASDY
jgi:hypothetical protein